MRELMLTMTGIALICGSFAALGPLAGFLSTLVAGVVLYVHGRRTERKWILHSGQWLIVLSSVMFLLGFMSTSTAGSRTVVRIVGGMAAPFVGHPQRILVVSGLLLAAGGYVSLLRRRVTWEPVAAAVAWAAFAAWEEHCRLQQYNIRVDLLLVSPLLAVVTLWAVIQMTRGVYRSWNGDE